MSAEQNGAHARERRDELVLPGPPLLDADRDAPCRAHDAPGTVQERIAESFRLGLGELAGEALVAAKTMKPAKTMNGTP